MELNSEQRDILRHAMGYGRRTEPGWRNHFVTGHGTTDHPHCEALLAAGLMTKREGSALSGWDAVYTVTAEGKAVARSKTPNVEFSGVPAGRSSKHHAGGTSAGTKG